MEKCLAIALHRVDRPGDLGPSDSEIDHSSAL